MIRNDRRYTARTLKVYDFSRLTSDMTVTLDALCAGLPPHDVLSRALSPLFSSPSFLTLLADIGHAGQDWVLCFEHLPDGDYAIDEDLNTVWVDTCGMLPEAIAQSVYFSNTLRANVLRAVREIWHACNAQRGLYEDARDLDVESLIKAERVKAADIECFTILCAHETQGFGASSEIWRHMMGGDVGDMAIVFGRTLERAVSAHNRIDLAMQEAFKQWYRDAPRVDACDHRTLEELDQELLCEDGRPQPRRVTIKPADLCRMTQRGCGEGSYLGDLNVRLLRDPAYADMHDPINQAHLLHIMHDLEVTRVGDVPFRNADLARLIFPDHDTVRVES